jgi:hypothetical protein
MHIAKVRNRNAKPSFLLRETYREHGKVKLKLDSKFYELYDIERES